MDKKYEPCIFLTGGDWLKFEFEGLSKDAFTEQ